MTHKAVVDALIDEQGALFSSEVGANIDRDAPQQWFHWLLTAQLCSARIAGRNALQAAAALKTAGLHKIDAILDSSRPDRIRLLNANGYARFDNVGADQMHAAARLVRDRYDDDLRALRAKADGDPGRILDLLREVKGIGPVGAGIYCREAQMVWDELFPMADPFCQRQAETLGLPRDAEKLADLAGGRDRFVLLLAALARAAIDGPAERVKQAAA